MKIILIDSSFSDIRTREGDDLQDAIEGFWSEVWEQGYDPDKKILDMYGDWMVYVQSEYGTLVPQQRLRNLRICP